MTKACSLAIIFLLYLGSTAQPVRNCGTSDYHTQQVKVQPGLVQQENKIEQFTQLRAKFSQRNLNVVRIPVVVHIIYNNQEQNISERQILSQIDVLNEDFQRENRDATLTDPLFKNLAADVGVEFVLANVDPFGDPTTGVTRTYTSKSSFIAFSDEMKFDSQGGKNAWPASDYLNIWVCNLAMGVLGFAQFPGGNSRTDGVVIAYQFFGREGKVLPPFNKGRTTTHEVGHWLNLKHIWGDDPCGDDNVPDTPPAEYPHHGCIESDTSCKGPNMVQNYMDYTDDGCMNFFTKGQRTRMRSLFDPGGARASLLNSRGYNPSLKPSCQAPIAASTNNITEQTANISWTAVTQARGYRVRMRKLPDGQWKTRLYTENRGNVIQLWACTSYEYQVKTLCAKDSSEYSASTTFTTACESGAPTNLVVLQNGATQALVGWKALPNVSTYEVQYLKQGQKIPFALRSATNSVLLKNLQANQTYFFRVRAWKAGKAGSYSKTVSFKTKAGDFVAKKVPARLKVSPQPIQDQLLISLLQPKQLVVSLSVLDNAGEVLHNKPTMTLTPGAPYKLGVEKLPPGSYTLECMFSDKSKESHEFHILSLADTTRGGK